MDTLSYKTKSANKATVTRNWYVVDADSKILGRLSSEIAKVVRGKHKPDFTPNVDCGDYVIVVNAGKVALSANKATDKEYITHSGFPGGQKRRSATEMLAKNPVSLVEEAVRGMLPKNKLGKKIFHNMFVYEGSEHPHQAQQPVELKF